MKGLFTMTVFFLFCLICIFTLLFFQFYLPGNISNVKDLDSVTKYSNNFAYCLCTCYCYQEFLCLNKY